MFLNVLMGVSQIWVVSPPSLLPLIKRSLVRASSLFLIDQLVGISLGQSEASIEVTWYALTNQRPVSIIGKLMGILQSRLRLREQNEVIKISNKKIKDRIAFYRNGWNKDIKKFWRLILLCDPVLKVCFVVFASCVLILLLESGNPSRSSDIRNCSQSEASIKVMWSVLTNQRRVSETETLKRVI